MSWHASSGLGAWSIQRLSAIYMSIFSTYALIQFLSRDSFGYQSWIGWVADPINKIVIGLFVLSLLVHAWVGSRDIILDYVKPFYFRIIKLSITAFLLLAMGLWALTVLVNVTPL